MYVDPSAFVLTDGVSKADSSLKNDVLNLNLLMALISAPDGNVKYPFLDFHCWGPSWSPFLYVGVSKQSVSL